MGNQERTLRLASLGLALWMAVLPRAARAHCEIPCGIYNDQMRVEMLEEDFQTIEKAMKQIGELESAKEKNFNQLVRWIDTKETHANRVQDVVSQYFLTQRVPPVPEDAGPAYQDYVKKVTLLQQMLVYAMKCKQTTDLANVQKLRTLLGDFGKLYFKEAPKEHKQD